jgi:predicted nucleic acid-binding protein
VTTPNDSDRFVVDSTGWVEYLGGGPKADAFAPYLERRESLFLPTIVVYEVYKKLLRERGSHMALEFLSDAFAFYERLISLDIYVAELAARISIDTKLAMADAMIYASARAHHSVLVTSDPHFSGLEFVAMV